MQQMSYAGTLAFRFYQMKTKSLSATALLPLQALVYIHRNTRLKKGGPVALGHPA